MYLEQVHGVLKPYPIIIILKSFSIVLFHMGLQKKAFVNIERKDKTLRQRSAISVRNVMYIAYKNVVISIYCRLASKLINPVLYVVFFLQPNTTFLRNTSP